MPLRSYFIPVAPRWQRVFFHVSTIRRQGGPNHYETLQLPTDASLEDVKKSFYTLSKTHHPDRNPDDPKASERFIKISEAYAVLSDGPKRQAYDREHLRTPSYAPARPGSYSSSGPAGGRPASGLSRRRSQFRGPPPSFYASGGWGAQSAKRSAAHEQTTYDHSQGGPTYKEGGMGPGQRAWGHGSNDVPHFDRDQHFRTQENQQKRRSKKVNEDFLSRGDTRSALANFIFVGSIISIGLFVPSYLFEKFGRGVDGVDKMRRSERK